MMGAAKTTGGTAAVQTTERAPGSFVVVDRGGGKVAIEFHPYHDTVSVLKGRMAGFDLLNGFTKDQARRLTEMLNESVISVFFASTGK
jgi:hypothetical protein